MAKRFVKSAGCGNMIGISTETSPDDWELRLIWEIPAYEAVATWGDAFRCSHHPLERENALE